ncbi:unnamed protein product [Cyprideis torosa]|uniref:Uncharacterized protein n=1 Tax=Cyprideis torosa TaxID=163714 RepID=A0A7R8WF39_9CRUS|nr:unnamed protein product [Cyprideis torosa]CAG0890198.1 unnamed protein product [Cyprideis torosa]
MLKTQVWLEVEALFNKGSHLDSIPEDKPFSVSVYFPNGKSAEEVDSLRAALDFHYLQKMYKSSKGSDSRRPLENRYSTDIFRRRSDTYEPLGNKEPGYYHSKETYRPGDRYTSSSINHYQPSSVDRYKPFPSTDLYKPSVGRYEPSVDPYKPPIDRYRPTPSVDRYHRPMSDHYRPIYDQYPSNSYRDDRYDRYQHHRDDDFRLNDRYRPLKTDRRFGYPSEPDRPYDRPIYDRPSHSNSLRPYPIDPPPKLWREERLPPPGGSSRDPSMFLNRDKFKEVNGRFIAIDALPADEAKDFGIIMEKSPSFERPNYREESLGPHRHQTFSHNGLHSRPHSRPTEDPYNTPLNDPYNNPQPDPFRPKPTNGHHQPQDGSIGYTYLQPATTPSTPAPTAASSPSGGPSSTETLPLNDDAVRKLEALIKKSEQLLGDNRQRNDRIYDDFNFPRTSIKPIEPRQSRRDPDSLGNPSLQPNGQGQIQQQWNPTFQSYFDVDPEMLNKAKKDNLQTGGQEIQKNENYFGSSGTIPTVTLSPKASPLTSGEATYTVTKGTHSASASKQSASDRISHMPLLESRQAFPVRPSSAADIHNKETREVSATPNEREERLTQHHAFSSPIGQGVHRVDAFKFERPDLSVTNRSETQRQVSSRGNFERSLKDAIQKSPQILITQKEEVVKHHDREKGIIYERIEKVSNTSHPLSAAILSMLEGHPNLPSTFHGHFLPQTTPMPPTAEAPGPPIVLTNQQAGQFHSPQHQTPFYPNPQGNQPATLAPLSPFNPDTSVQILPDLLYPNSLQTSQQSPTVDGFNHMPPHNPQVPSTLTPLQYPHQPSSNQQEASLQYHPLQELNKGHLYASQYSNAQFQPLLYSNEQLSAAQYPNAQPPTTQYSNEQFPAKQYPNEQLQPVQYATQHANAQPTLQYPNEHFQSAQYHKAQHSNEQIRPVQYATQYPNAQPTSQYPNEQFPSAPYPDAQHSNEQLQPVPYASQYPNAQLPTTPNAQFPAVPYPNPQVPSTEYPSPDIYAAQYPQQFAVPQESTSSREIRFLDVAQPRRPVQRSSSIVHFPGNDAEATPTKAPHMEAVSGAVVVRRRKGGTVHFGNKDSEKAGEFSRGDLHVHWTTITTTPAPLSTTLMSTLSLKRTTETPALSLKTETPFSRLQVVGHKPSKTTAPESYVLVNKLKDSPIGIHGSIHNLNRIPKTLRTSTTLDPNPMTFLVSAGYTAAEPQTENLDAELQWKLPVA